MYQIWDVTLDGAPYMSLKSPQCFREIPKTLNVSYVSLDTSPDMDLEGLHINLRRYKNVLDVSDVTPVKALNAFT